MLEIMYLRIFGLSSAVRMGRFNYRIIKVVLYMTMLQEKAVQMIQNMSDENVGFLIEIIQRLIPQKNI